jgi:hypothetical protein
MIIRDCTGELTLKNANVLKELCFQTDAATKVRRLYHQSQSVFWCSPDSTLSLVHWKANKWSSPLLK